MDIASRIARSTRRFARSLRSTGAFTIAAALLAAVHPAGAAPAALARGPQFLISVDPALRHEPLTGRIFVFVSRNGTPEPRLQYAGLANTVPLFGIDVDALPAGKSATIDAGTLGYPIAAPRDLPPGDYAVQALANVYTRFTRADGNTLWLHNDRGEGQQFTISPGNLVSATQHVHIDPTQGGRVRLSLSKSLPPLPPPIDTAWVKHVRMQSPLLTKFWGVPMFLGATILLPKEYDAGAMRRYPTVYVADHFTTAAPFGFDPASRPDSRADRAAHAAATNAETPYEFTQAWIHGDAPPIVAIAFEHPTPYYDDSYAVNSANNGPYGDAIVTELIPKLESEVHLVRDGHARFLIGASTGGWSALALQVYHPDAFNGAWAIAPDPVDFHRFELVDLYADTSAFTVQRTAWIASEIPAQRSSDGNTVQTMREESRLELVLGSRGRSGEQFNAWDAAFGPVLQDGYPGEIWNKRTGIIDRDVVTYMRAHGYDLRDYLARNWPRIGVQLAGKIHVDVADADDYFLNLACERLQALLDGTDNPPAKAAFAFGRPDKPHGWQAKTTVDYLRAMIERAQP